MCKKRSFHILFSWLPLFHWTQGCSTHVNTSLSTLHGTLQSVWNLHEKRIFPLPEAWVFRPVELWAHLAPPPLCMHPSDGEYGTADHPHQGRLTGLVSPLNLYWLLQVNSRIRWSFPAEAMEPWPAFDTVLSLQDVWKKFWGLAPNRIADRNAGKAREILIGEVTFPANLMMSLHVEVNFHQFTSSGLWFKEKKMIHWVTQNI